MNEVTASKELWKGKYMGLRFRKSIRLGKCFRINISKSGIGYSFGVSGARLTYSANKRITSTIGIPGTGISYTTSHKRNTPSNQNTIPIQKTQGVGVEVSTEHANISDFQSAEMQDLLKTIRTAKNTNTFGIILLIFGLLILIAFSKISIAFVVSGIIGTTLGIVLIILAHTKLPAHLEYEMEDYYKKIHVKRLEAWRRFFSSKTNWQTITSAHVINKKINAGASALVKRVKVNFTKGAPFYIKTDVEIIRLNLNGEKILILPDKLIVIKNFSVGAIDYQDIKITTYKQGFIEDGIVPKDAQIINYTWRYVNKNGTPDKRFNNNRKLPVCSYGYASITSSSGLEITLSCSNNQNIDNLQELTNCSK